MKEMILLIAGSIGVMAAACYALAVILFPRDWFDGCGNVGDEFNGETK